MSAASAPFGFIPDRHPTGECRAVAYKIASGYASQISKNQPVTLDTNGTITAGAAATDLLGVFAGCEYIGADGKPVVSNFWPAGTVATEITAWVYDDPANEYLVQADGPVAAGAIGDQGDITNAAATANGMSTATLGAALKGAAVQGQFRIIGFDRGADNVAGDAFTKVKVKIARHQFIAAKVAI